MLIFATLTAAVPPPPPPLPLEAGAARLRLQFAWDVLNFMPAHLFEADWAADVASLLGINSDRVTIVDHEPVPVPAGKSYFPFAMTFDLLAGADNAATMHEHVYEIKEALPWDGIVATGRALTSSS